MQDNVDLLKPWTVKAVATRVSDEITAEARRESLTVGQLVEKIWDAWKADGTQSANVDLVAHVATLLHAAGALPEHIPLPREARALINDYARMARGLPAQKAKADQVELSGQTPPAMIGANGAGAGEGANDA